MARQSESYTARISIEEVFSRKLETLCARIRDIVYSGLVYVVSAQYCCKFCKCRILVRGNERVYCPRCQTVPFWSEATRSSVAQLLQHYPTLQECQAQQRPVPPSKDITPQKVAYGARIEEARQALGWSQEYLASQIIKANGDHIARSTINAIERGVQSPSPYIKEQLERLLGLRERIAV